MSKSIKSVSGRGTESKDTGINFFKTSQTINPCLIQPGIPQKRAGKKNFDCVFINFEDTYFCIRIQIVVPFKKSKPVYIQNYQNCFQIILPSFIL